MKSLAHLLLIIGLALILIATFLTFQRHNPDRLQFEVDNSSVAIVEHKTTPARIIIESQDINLPILESQVSGNKWETTSKGVSFLSSSVSPGKTGNSILYGHNWGSLLGDLDKVAPGEKIIIVMSDGSEEKFEIEFTQTVKPSDSSILDESTDSRITLYTCSGFLDQNRFVVTALLIENS